MIYITGDTHGNFERIAHFCTRMQTKSDDVMIILGDAGINFSGGWRDQKKKEYISTLPITLFCIHGNHEKRPHTIPSYIEKEWHGGSVYLEERFPSILFAKDGEIYNLNGLQAIVIGGAYSIDWMYRTPGHSWWPDEQPSAEIKKRVENKLEQHRWNIDVVLSHTVPLKYEPVEVFLTGIDQSRVDKSTEKWLDNIEDRLRYSKWYVGHYHTQKQIDALQIMFEDYAVVDTQTLKSLQLAILSV